MIRVSGAGGGNDFTGAAFPNGYGGNSPLARGGAPTSVGSAGGGSSLFGDGGTASSMLRSAGILGSGGAGKSSSAAAAAGGDGFCYLFWEGKKS